MTVSPMACPAGARSPAARAGAGSCTPASPPESRRREVCHSAAPHHSPFGICRCFIADGEMASAKSDSRADGDLFLVDAAAAAAAVHLEVDRRRGCRDWVAVAAGLLLAAWPSARPSLNAGTL